jgi:hypothetical protein
MVKTTVQLPEALWEAAKMRAITERTDLRSIIVTALESHLRVKSERKGKQS